MSILALCSKLLNKYADVLHIQDDELKFQLIDMQFDQKFSSTSQDILFLIDDGDDEYRELINRLYLGLNRKFKIKATDEEKANNLLNDIFTEITIRTVVNGIADNFESRKIYSDAYVKSFGKIDYISNEGEPDYVKGITNVTDTPKEEIIAKLFDIIDNVKKDIVIKTEDDLYREQIAKDIISDIMSVYDSLYENNFLIKPLGILTNKGILRLDKDYNPYIDRFSSLGATDIYNLITSEVEGCLKHNGEITDLNSSYINADGTLNYNYCPLLHLYNVNGVYKDSNGKVNVYSQWDDFRKVLYAVTKSRILSALTVIDIDNHEVIKRFSKGFKTLMTMSLFVIEYDKTTITNLRGVLNGSITKLEKTLRENGRELLDAKIGKLICCENNQMDVTSIIYTYNENVYANEILFSYKMYDKLIGAGVKPNYGKLVIGRGIKGENFTMNFASPQNLVTSIIAGSGSGKGVVTLNILAGLIADNVPVCYVDFKPDMAAMLWNADRQYNTPIYAVDSLSGVNKHGSRPRRDAGFGLNAPDIPQLQDYFRLMPYLKSVQLFILISMLRSSGLACKTQNRVMFIFDELQGMNSDFGAMLQVIDDSNKRNSDTPFSEDAKPYVAKLLQVFKTDLNAGVTKFVKTTGRQGTCGCICLGQAVNPGEWVCGPLSWNNSPLSRIVKASSYRMAGARHNEGNSSYGLNADKTKYAGANFIKENKMGYWGVHSGFSTPSGGAGITCVKSYLTLNENDIDKAISNGYSLESPNPDTFTGGLLVNVDKDMKDYIVANDMYKPDGSINEKIGFAGLVKSLMLGVGGNVSDEDLKANLSQGYQVAMEALRYCNIECECLEDYLYDCSIDSLYTLGELLARSSGAKEIDSLGISITPDDMIIEDEDGTVYDCNGEKQNTTTENSTSKSPLDIASNINAGDLGGNTEKAEKTDNNKGYVVSSTDEHSDAQDIALEKAKEDERRKREQEDKLRAINQGSQHSNQGVEDSRKTSMNTFSEPNEHSFELKPDESIMKLCQSDSINKVYALNQLSKLLISQMDKDFGLDRVHTFEVVGDGYIRLNGTLYKPFLPNMIIETLPVDVRNGLKKGQIIELFNFVHLYKLRGLEVLSIENPRLAEGRVRRELGLKPKQSWLAVFKKFRNLDKIVIAGVDVKDEESAERYESDFSKGFSLGESLVNKFFGGGKPKKEKSYGSVNPLIHTGKGLANTMQKSRTCRVATKAFGYTMGLKAVTIASTIFGPWGVLFGAMAVYGTVTQARKNGGLFADSDNSIGNVNPGNGFTNEMYDDTKNDRGKKAKSSKSSKNKAKD